MYYIQKDTPAEARTTTLNEELGQVGERMDGLIQFNVYIYRWTFYMNGGMNEVASAKWQNNPRWSLLPGGVYLLRQDRNSHTKHHGLQQMLHQREELWYDAHLRLVPAYCGSSQVFFILGSSHVPLCFCNLIDWLFVLSCVPSGDVYDEFGHKVEITEVWIRNWITQITTLWTVQVMYCSNTIVKLNYKLVTVFWSISLQRTACVDFSFNPLSDRKFKFHDSSLLEAIKMEEPSVQDFFRLLALCHTVMPEEKNEGNV